MLPSGRRFHLDWNLTNQCSLRCSYCVESGHFEERSGAPLGPRLYQWIDRFLESDLLKSNYDGLAIAFWGGEPTLEWPAICALVERYLPDPRMSFILYTNGYHLPEEMQRLLIKVNETVRAKNGRMPLVFQISYDGQPIHDLCRRTVTGKPSATKVVETIRWAQEHAVPYEVKSTVTVEHLKHLYAAWKDVSDLTYGKARYFPTVDYFNPITPEQERDLDVHLSEMKVELRKIAAAILAAKKDGRRVSDFKWFEPARHPCQAGQGTFGLDVDGKIYSCHSALYSKAKSDHYVGTLEDDFSIFTAAADKHCGLKPEVCRTCDAVFCLACNVGKYQLSKKETYLERWMDFGVSESTCRIYREISKVTRAFVEMRDAV